ncbi:hypothetical protein M513_07602 [Trichuris suis]|uniref:Uncharacterized protein n=1 Tax=Trichuris suis TaxID=68888 RepID=A0A085M2V6_9BILA|nr:hypothetical protein M513_07602 [Trichuris suis]
MLVQSKVFCPKSVHAGIQEQVFKSDDSDYRFVGRLPCKYNDLEDSRSNACSFENYNKPPERYGQSMLVTKVSSKLTALLFRGGDESRYSS